MDISQARPERERFLHAGGECVVADPPFLETVLTAVLARGHALIEDRSDETLTTWSYAPTLGLSFDCNQFTPDHPLVDAAVDGTQSRDGVGNVPAGFQPGRLRPGC